MGKTFYKLPLLLLSFIVLLFILDKNEAQAVTTKSLSNYQYKWKLTTGASLSKVGYSMEIFNVDQKTGNVTYGFRGYNGTDYIGVVNSSGKKVWKNNVKYNKGYYEEFFVKGKYIIGTFFDEKKGNLEIHFFNLSNGKIVKKIYFNTYKISNGLMPSVYVDDKYNVIVAVDNKMVGVSFQGKKLWEKKPTLPYFSDYNIDILHNDPVIVGDHVVSSSLCRGFYCKYFELDELTVFSMKTGKKLWSTKVDTFNTYITKDKKSIVLKKADDKIVSYNLKTGKKQWERKIKLSKSEYLSVQLDENMNMLENSKGTIYLDVIKETKNPDFITSKLIAIDKNGKQKWSSSVSSYKDKFVATSFSKDGKTFYSTGVKSSYKINSTTGKVTSTKYQRKSAIPYSKYSGAPLVKRTSNHLIGMDYYTSKLNSNIHKNTWNSKYTIFNKSEKKLGTIQVSSKVSSPDVYVTNKNIVYLIDSFTIYAYYHKK